MKITRESNLAVCTLHAKAYHAKTPLRKNKLRKIIDPNAFRSESND